MGLEVYKLDNESPSLIFHNSYYKSYPFDVQGYIYPLPDLRSSHVPQPESIVNYFNYIFNREEVCRCIFCRICISYL